MNGKISLHELQLVIRDSLYIALPDMYWVVAEISEIKENYSGHCYLELVEKLPEDSGIRARAKAVIWSNRYRFLKSYFENMTGESLGAGQKILIRVKIEYHEIYGLSLVINDIDPAFTLGEMAIKRQQILKKLEDEGVITMNKELEFPFIPQRVAVISSSNSAGYTDFIKHLGSNSYGYVFYTTLFETPMQGAETEKGIVTSLDRIASVIENFDVTVIIRGGGSQTDLSWFDNYNIAYYITQFPLPVISGIGHEKDMSVTDIVAYKSLKTPTAVADHLIERMNNAENRLIEISHGIIESTQLIIDRNRQRIDASRIKLFPYARMMIAEFRENLSGILIDMMNTGKEFVMRAGISTISFKSRISSGVKTCLTRNETLVARNRLDLTNHTGNYISNLNTRITGFKNSLIILDPDNVLKRGYTITSMNGKIIKSRDQIGGNDLIDTRFSDGSVKSRVLTDKQLIPGYEQNV
jgi:exodeoxyribonuclease VII large subunit